MRVSSQDLAASVGRNTLFGMVAGATRIGTRMLMVPMVVAYLGIEGYGIWAIIMAIMAYMQIGVAGVRSAFQKYVAEAIGTGDHDRASTLLSTGCVIGFGIYFLVLIPVVVFARDMVQAIGVPEPFTSSAASAVIVLFFAVNIGNIGGVFESIVMGAQRIDLVMKAELLLLCAEAAFIIIALFNGFGLLAMTIIVALSQAFRTAYFYFKASQVVPLVRVRVGFFSRAVLRELFRFAGSYQLLNLIEVLYLNILPIVILKFYGAKIAGIYAICAKLVQAAALAPEALLLPLLSGGTFINYSKRLSEKRHDLAEKSLKMMMTVALPALAFIMLFGEKIVFAWAGEKSDLISIGLVMLAAVYLFRAIAQVCFVLYRATGGASKDIAWQALRLLALTALIGLGHRFWGYPGVLGAALLAELLGMVLMLQIISSSNPTFFAGFRASLPSIGKLVGVVALGSTVGLAVISAPIALQMAERLAVAIKLSLAFGALTIVISSVLWFTNYFSTDERQVVTKSLSLFFR